MTLTQPDANGADDSGGGSADRSRTLGAEEPGADLDPEDLEDGALGHFEPEEEIEPAGTAGHLVAGVVPVVIGIFGLVYSLSLSLGTPVEAGPGLWPTVVSVALIGAGIWALVTERRAGDVERFSRGALRIGVGIVSLIAFVQLISLVGFEIPTLLLLAFWLKVLGKESWLITVSVSVLTTAGFYLLFVVLLGVPLPRLVY